VVLQSDSDGVPESQPEQEEPTKGRLSGGSRRKKFSQDNFRQYYFGQPCLVTGWTLSLLYSVRMVGTKRRSQEGNGAQAARSQYRKAQQSIFPRGNEQRLGLVSRRPSDC